jgi:hypothetical protein
MYGAAIMCCDDGGARNGGIDGLEMVEWIGRACGERKLRKLGYPQAITLYHGLLDDTN